MTRVVVIGAGISGCLAALTAKQKAPEASVSIISTAPDRYEHERGTIDVLGYSPEKTGPIERPLFESRNLPESHPYRRLGRLTVQNALDTVDDLLVDDEVLPYCSGTTRNALVPTPLGGFRPVSRYPAGMRAGVLSNQQPMKLVGFEEVSHLDAELAGGRLDEVTPYDVTSMTVEFPVEPDSYPPLFEFANALDENRETEDGTPVREALAASVRPELDIEPRVGFPAMLGLVEHESVRKELESRLQAEVFEVPVGEPSVPGVRLRRRLFELLDAADVDPVEATCEGFDTDGETIRSIHLDERSDSAGENTIQGDAFVLATGGLAAGGLVASFEGVREPVFDCPVSHPEDVRAWSDRNPLGDHPFARFGVETTSELRPRSPGGQALYSNLYAAGAVLGGHNFVSDLSRTGVAVVTGYEAGRRAVAED